MPLYDGTYVPRKGTRLQTPEESKAERGRLEPTPKHHLLDLKEPVNWKDEARNLLVGLTRAPSDVARLYYDITSPFVDVNANDEYAGSVSRYRAAQTENAAKKHPIGTGLMGLGWNNTVGLGMGVLDEADRIWNKFYDKNIGYPGSSLPAKPK